MTAEEQIAFHKLLAPSLVGAVAIAVLLRLLLYPIDIFGLFLVVLGPSVGYGIASVLKKRLSKSLVGYAARISLRGLIRKGVLDVSEDIAALLSFASVVPATTLAIGLLSFLFLGEPLIQAFAASATSLLVPIAGIMYYNDKPRERNNRTDAELPFFNTYLTIMANCGLTVYNAFRQLRAVPNIFKHMSVEAGEVEKLIEFSGKGTIEGMEMHAIGHPNDLYQSTILQAASIQRVGGNVAAALEDKMKESLKRMEERFTAYSNLASMLGEVAVILLFIMPVSIALTSILNPDIAAGLAIMVTTTVTPVLGIVLYMVIRAASPAKYDIYNVKPSTLLLAIASGAVLSAILALVGGVPIPVSFSAGGLVASTILYIHFRPQVAEVDQTEVELRRFLRDIIEFRRLGHSITVSLARVSANSYKPYFSQLVKRVAGRVSLGLTIWQAGNQARSWLARMSFFLLHAIEVSGGSSPHLIEIYTDTLRGYEVARNSAKSKMRVFGFIAMAGPLIGGFTLSLVIPLVDLLSNIGKMVSAAGPMGFYLPIPTLEDVKRMTDYSMLLIIVTTLFLAVSLGRAVDLHPYGFHRLIAVFILSIATYYIIPAMADAVRTTLVPWGGEIVGS